MIAKATIKNKFFKELKLDFTKSDRSIYKYIVLAGNNGCGKTSVLESFSHYFESAYMSTLPYCEFTKNGQTYIMEVANNVNDYHCYITTNGIKSGLISNGGESGNIDSRILRSCGYAYSKARSGFRMSGVDKIGTSDVDTKNLIPDNDDYTDIKSLLIDIDFLDNKHFREFTVKHPELLANTLEEEFYKESKIKRFKDAFNNFFNGTLLFSKIGDPANGKYSILFLKNGKEVDIDNLSTGEKQIVCRGARLLMNVSLMEDSIVLIDEPELSMHPLWQKKIFKFYCDLFHNNGMRNTQLIFATHSEYVIESALKDEDALVIILKDTNGVIEQKRITAPFCLSTILACEINYEAFGIFGVDYHMALYTQYQNRKNEFSIKGTDNLLKNETIFNTSLHQKICINTKTGEQYYALPTYIRNNIDHPDNGQPYSEEELKESIEFLRKIV